MNYFKIAIILIFVISFSAKSQIKLKTGFYYLAEKEDESILIKDIDSEDIFAVEKNVILDIDDFKSVKLVKCLKFATIDSKSSSLDLEVIKIKLTKTGKKKWVEIQKRISKTGESIVFVCNDNIYFELQFMIDNYTPLVNDNICPIFINPIYIKSVFTTIKDEIDNK